MNFGWLTTLIHENVHAQGDHSEDNTYKKEVDSFNEHIQNFRDEMHTLHDSTTKLFQYWSLLFYKRLGTLLQVILGIMKK